MLSSFLVSFQTDLMSDPNMCLSACVVLPLDKKVFLPTMGSSSQKWSILFAAPLRLLCSLSTAHPRFLGYKASPGDLGHIGPWSPAMPSPAKTQMENDPNNPRDFFNRKILCLIILQLYNTCLNLVSDRATTCFRLSRLTNFHFLKRITIGNLVFETSLEERLQYVSR